MKWIRFRRGLLAGLALLACSPFLSYAQEEEPEYKNLLDRVQKHIKSERAEVREQERALRDLARAMDLDETLDKKEAYQQMRVLGDDLYENRAFLDARIAIRDSLKTVYRRLKRLDLEKDRRVEIHGRVDDLFLTYYDCRLAQYLARVGLAESLTDEERKKAEEILTLREAQLDDAHGKIMDFLITTSLLEPGEDLP